MALIPKLKFYKTKIESVQLGKTLDSNLKVFSFPLRERVKCGGRLIRLFQKDCSNFSQIKKKSKSSGGMGEGRGQENYGLYPLFATFFWIAPLRLDQLGLAN